jgi:hypothetical protein
MRKRIVVTALLWIVAGLCLHPNVRTQNVAGRIVKCDAFQGADAGAKLAACFAALSVSGGTADARELSWEQSITNDVFAGVTKPGRLLLGETTYTLSGAGCFNVPTGWTVEGSPKSIIRGVGSCKVAGGRIVLATGSHVVLHGFKVQGSGKDGEQCLAVMNGINDVVIEETWEDRCGQYGIMAASNEKSPSGGFNDIRILNNRISDLGTNHGSNIGIEVFPRSGKAESAGEGYLAKGLTIRGNSVMARVGAEIGCGIKMSGADHGTIEDNSVDETGVQITDITAGGICVVLSEGAGISNNKILGGKNGISVSGLIDPRNPRRNHNVLITGNVLTGQTQNGIYSAEGQEGLVIEHNNLTSNRGGTRGIWLQKRSQAYEQTSIADNEISLYPIAIDVDSSDARVKPNIARNKTSGKVDIK